MSYLLGIISTLIGVLDFIAFNGLLRVMLAIFFPIDPARALRSRYMGLTMERVGVLVFGLLWLIGILYVFHYYERSNSRRMLLKRFAKVTVIELAIAAVGYAVPYLLTLF